MESDAVGSTDVKEEGIPVSENVGAEEGEVMGTNDGIKIGVTQCLEQRNIRYRYCCLYLI